MADRVIDRFESIEIDKEQRHLAALARGAVEKAFQAIGQQRSVRQLGERIEVSQLLYALFGLLAFGDVREDADVVRDAAADMDRANRQPSGVQVAVLAAVDDLALPMAFRAQRAPHAGVKHRVLTPGSKDALPTTSSSE